MTDTQFEKKRLTNPPKNLRIEIARRKNLDSEQSTDVFEFPYRRNLNVISVLMEIRKEPRTVEGKDVDPPVWDMNCLEQVCGICTMVINGNVRQACSALVDDLLVESGGNTIKLAPMSKFPNVRDLQVDRNSMFENLKRTQAWISLDGSHALGPGPTMSQEVQAERYAYSRCMTCGCCLEACPQYGDDSYVGAQAIAQVRLFNMHPTGKTDRDKRLDALMEDDGITNCGNSQNCVQVCPMNIPLTRAIYETNREITVHGLFGWFRK